jgi:chemotaxis protein CheC
MLKDYGQLGPIGQSVIAEMANIGLGNATTSLATMTGKVFDMGVPDAKHLSLEELPLAFADSFDPYVGIYMPVEGEATGHMGFFLSWSSAQSLWRMLLGVAPESPDEISELDASSLIEVGNIINGSFLRALTDFANVNMMACPPVMSVDMMSAMLASMAVECASEDHFAISIRTEISDRDETFSGFFLMIPSVDGLAKMFANLGLSEAA